MKVPIVFYRLHSTVISMNSRAIWGISIAAIFAVSMISAAYAVGHLLIDDITVEKPGRNGVAQSVHIEVSVDVPDPTGADYGWAVGTSKGFLVITSHPNIGDDSTGQPPLNAYHTHFLTADSGGPCDPLPHATFATKNEVGKLSIMGDMIWVENVPRGLAGDLTESGFGFTLFTSGGDLCINPVP